MQYSREVEEMVCVKKGPNHGPAPIPEEGKWVQAKEIKDISGLTHGIGWCAPQQGACKLTLNVKNGVIEEALIETLGCSGMTHSAAMASEILPGKTILEALNSDLVCDAINTAMRELFLQIVYGRTQSAFSEDGLAIGAGLEDLGKGLRSQVGTMYSTGKKGQDVTLEVGQWNDGDKAKSQYDTLAEAMTGKELGSGNVKVSGKTTGAYSAKADPDDDTKAVAVWRNDTVVFYATGAKNDIQRFYQQFPL